MAEGVLMNQLEERIHLLSISSSHLRKKYEDTNFNCLRGWYTVTILIEDNLNKNRLGRLFFTGHSFWNKIIWDNNNNYKQESTKNSPLNWNTC